MWKRILVSLILLAIIEWAIYTFFLAIVQEDNVLYPHQYNVMIFCGAFIVFYRIAYEVRVLNKAKPSKADTDPYHRDPWMDKK